ncbi:hypothetical protein QFC19_008833 [Naganishia cerealis]|uniref:Uncharacterized protein n=1 Tax=Naganishia cerealis TaxID=610337 RepID=A0ACC2UYM7_9TREE|nr:hypothetical protein QFC19_008833 [Naganishia cerealis]
MSAPTNLETTGFVSSRFVSQTELDEAALRKQEEWKAAYARLGQEPPPQETEGEYDPRSLYERLHAQKETKREQWDEKMRMANQFRGLEADELQFLDETAQQERDRQRKVEQQDREELALFNLTTATPAATSSTSTTPKLATGGGKNKVKTLLKGVIRRKDTSIQRPRTTASVQELQAPANHVHDDDATSPVSPVSESSSKRKRSAVTLQPPPPPPQRVKATLAPALGALGGYESGSGSDDDGDADDVSGDGDPVDGQTKKAKLA